MDFERYERNMTAFSKEEVEAIHTKAVCVVGCGGLGGYVAQSLARFGVKKLTLVDGDVFVPSNLNRQLFCTEKNLGKSKAEEARKALTAINSGVGYAACAKMLTGENCGGVIQGHDAVVDCLDNVASRLVLEEGCRAAGLPLIHGAISGFAGQVSCIFPGDDTLQNIYAGGEMRATNNDAGNPPFTPMLVAAIQCSETLKLLAGRGNLLRNRLLVIDLSRSEFEVLELGTAQG